MITCTIWFADSPGSGSPQRVDVLAPDNAMCLETARLVWDALKAAGHYMQSSRP